MRKLGNNRFREIKDVPATKEPAPPPPPNQEDSNDIAINIELTGYEEIKRQLDDIETQLNRIYQKSEKLKMIK